MRGRAAWTAAAFAVAIAIPVRGALEPADPLPVDAVRVETVAGATAFHAVVAGKIAGIAVPRRAGGGREIVLLVTPPRPKVPDETQQKVDDRSRCDEPPGRPADAPEEPKRLVRFDPTGAGALVTLGTDLPAGARALGAADLDGDGADELLMTTGDGVEILRATAAGSWTREPLRPGGPAAGAVGTIEPGAVGTGGGRPDLVTVAGLGVLRAWRTDPDGAWKSLFDAELPVDAKRPRWGLELSSPAARRLPVPDGGDVVVTDPERRGADRLRTILVRPAAPEGERRIEVFAKLPGPERLMESGFLLLDGRPALAVTTMPAGKLSFFGEKLLRVFFVEGDRTRLGKPPALAVESGANLWQETYTVAADVDGDGREDVVLAYWKGLKDDTVVLDAYLRRADGSFEKSPRSTSFDAENANRDVLLYGTSFDGTGLPDLLLVADGKLAFHPGAPASAKGRALVAPKPQWVVPLEFSGGAGGQVVVSLGTAGTGVEKWSESGVRPWPVDLDGDGRTEILLLADGTKQRSYVLVVAPAR